MNDLHATFNDPHARHAMLVHLPIVLGSLGFLPVLAWLATRMKSRALLLTCIVTFAFASVGGLAAANAGEAAEDRVEQRLAPAAKASLERHEELGESAWLWPLIPGGLVAIAALIPSKRLKVGAGALALAASLGVCGWVALTAHEGGKLVYVHGVGVPSIPGLAGEGAPNPPAAAPADAPKAGREHDDD